MRVAAVNMLGIERPAKGRLVNRPSLVVGADVLEPTRVNVGFYGFDRDLMAALGEFRRNGSSLRSILQVTVARSEGAPGDDLPSVSGRYDLVEDGVRFTPHFPFEPGLSYRVSVDLRPLGYPTEVLTSEFSLPREKSAAPAEVKHIYPTGDELPENLLRFYVTFSDSMQRGRAAAEISVLGPDGEPVPDVLYRAPVELWDRSMRCLTVLLDPGRLKRGVGPNRELGPPLKSGDVYTLAIGAGMLDASGRQLPKPVFKRFRVTDAVREAVAIEQWKVLPPRADSRQPLMLVFPRPLDRALLSHTITVMSGDGKALGGKIVIDRDERRWAFTPAAPWLSGAYQVRVASDLEDVCGNNLLGAFDRPLRQDGDFARETANRAIPIYLEA
jgi:hypothetical protein